MSDDTKAAVSSETKSGIWGGNYPTIVDLLAVMGIFLTAQIISLAVTHFLGYNFDRVALNSTDELLRETAEFEVGRFSLVNYSITMFITVVATFIFGRIRGNKAPIARFSLRGFNPSVLLWSMLMLVSVAIIFDPLNSYLPSPPELYGRGWAMVATLIVVAPIMEELLCRGLVLEAVRARGGVWAATIVSAVLFSVLHLHPTASLNALVVGIILAYIYIRTDSIFAPIILHSFNNVLAYLLIWAGWDNITLREIIPSREIYIAVYIAAIITLLTSLIKIIGQLSRLRRQDKEMEK